MMRAIAGFFASKTKRRLFFLVLLGIGALAEFYFLGLARRTFVFYTGDSGIMVVEDRMVKRSPSREVNITRYMEELLLGPVSPDLLPLFPRETRLKALLYRNGVVYADFSADAALPPVEGGDVLDNFRILYTGIIRNFSFVRDVRIFIDGKAAYLTPGAGSRLYAEEFRQGGEAASREGLPGSEENS